MGSAQDPRRKWRDDVGRQLLGLDFEPLSDDPFQMDFQLLAADGAVRAAHMAHSAGMTFRDLELTQDGVDVLALLLATTGPLRVQQFGQEVELAPGEAIYVETCSPGTVGFTGSVDYMSVLVPRAAVRDAIKSEGRLIGQRWNAGAPALTMLQGYMASLCQVYPKQNPALNKIACRHLYDLVALSAQEAAGLQASAEAESIHAIRAKLAITFMENSFCNPDLRVSDIAKAQHVSLRYLQQVLEQEGVQFKAFIAERRLQKAYRDLTDPALIDVPILQIALSCGFSDISHFNRAFRARYDATPGAVRSTIKNRS